MSVPENKRSRSVQWVALLLACLWFSASAAQSADTGNASKSAETNCASTDTVQRRRPGHPVATKAGCDDSGLVPATWGPLPDFTPVPDRWRIASSLGYDEQWLNPYRSNNILKADRPAFGNDWFVSLSLVSDSTIEKRRVPTPVANATAPNNGSLDALGQPDQSAVTQNLIAEFVLYKGDTVFRPPDIEFRFIPVFNLSRVQVDEAGVLKADGSSDTTRTEGFLGIQGLFVDKHLRNVSERYDFDSIRIGIQPITADFRGFLFQDSPLGIRLFGTRDNNRWQYNLGWFRRIEKDTNSGLNDITENSLSDALRDDDVFLFNLYRQDFPVHGFTSQIVIAHNRNSEDRERYIDDNGFRVRPAALGVEAYRHYDVTYIGLNGDGHINKWNLSTSAYAAVGSESSATFNTAKSDIRAAFFAAELSHDYDWIRARVTVLYGSGDDDPYDDRATGFDAIVENPLIAGADTSFWIRQAVPLIGGGRVALSGANGLLNSMRSSKSQGQSNFSNPGQILIGLGADFDITPALRASFDVNQMWFQDTAVLEAARNQALTHRDIGQDVSFSLTYRPLISQNIILRVAASALLPGHAYKDLYGSEVPWSILANLILAY